MAQVTVEEPKTVTEEVTKFKCDNCGQLIDGAERWDFEIKNYSNAHGNRIQEDGDLCPDCAEAGEYLTLVQLWQDKQRIADLISTTIDWGGALFCVGLGVSFAGAGTHILWRELLVPSVGDGSIAGAAIDGSMFGVVAALLFGMLANKLNSWRDTQ